MLSPHFLLPSNVSRQRSPHVLLLNSASKQITNMLFYLVSGGQKAKQKAIKTAACFSVGLALFRLSLDPLASSPAPQPANNSGSGVRGTGGETEQKETIGGLSAAAPQPVYGFRAEVPESVDVWEGKGDNRYISVPCHSFTNVSEAP